MLQVTLKMCKNLKFSSLVLILSPQAWHKIGRALSFHFYFLAIYFLQQHFSQNKMFCLCLTLKRDGGEQGNSIRDKEAEVKIELKREKKKELCSSWQKSILVLSDIKENRKSSIKARKKKVNEPWTYDYEKSKWMGIVSKNQHHYIYETGEFLRTHYI